MPPSLSTPMTMKRIHREIADLKKEDLGPIVLEPSDNLQIWKGSIPGPQGSVYEGGTFLVEIQLPNDYPFSAPKVVFKTRIYHMNISEQGGICIDILKHNWSPALSLFKVMLSLSSLLTDPNPKDPLVPSVATQYVRNRKVHDDTAREWTNMYARTAPVPAPPVPTPIPAPTAVAAQPPPKSSRARGKKREEPQPSHTAVAGSSRSTRASTTADEVILLESDSEDAPAGSKGKKRKRASGAPASSAAGSSSIDADNILEVVDSEEEKTGTKKSRTQRKPSNTRSGPGAATASGGTRRSARQLGDVIVIDD